VIDLRIANAKVVYPWGIEEHAAVDVDDGRIVAVGKTDGSGHRVVDAAGLHLLPGFIDTHVHLNFLAEAEGADASIDEFRSETRAAALSGVTTALVYYRRLEPYGDDLARFIAHGERSSYVDFGVHLGILVDPHLDRLEELSREFGILSFKMYTCYKDDELRRFGVAGEDDGFILEVLERVARVPGAHVHVHAENEDIVRRATARVRANEAAFANAVAAWSAARPPVAEAVAFRRTAFLARQAGCRLFIPHVSGATALGQVRDARVVAGREAILAETCPQYLLLSAEDPPEGTLGKINPPIRERADNAALVDALQAGEIDVVGTDHGTTTRAGKDGLSVIDARPGFPGMATLGPALLTLAHRRQLALETIARFAHRAALIFRLPRKGLIQPGYDADIVLVDPGAGRIVRAAELGSASDFSVFEGRELYGWPRMTVVRGRVVAEEGELVADVPAGRYLRRSAS
jgi:dihydroorotase-like cyclic amidohydrolase